MINTGKAEGGNNNCKILAICLTITIVIILAIVIALVVALKKGTDDYMDYSFGRNSDGNYPYELVSMSADDRCVAGGIIAVEST